MNIKTPFHGQPKNDSRLDPVTKFNETISFLQKFTSWLKTWQALCVGVGKDSGMKGLTKETFMAMVQTTSTLPELALYLLEKKDFSFVLLGQLQSDPLEKSFGWYRQLWV